MAMVSLLSTLAPFGVGIFAIGAIVYIYGYNGRQTWVVVLALSLVTIIYFVEKITAQSPQLPSFKPDSAAAAPVEPAQSSISWVDTGVFADWGGADYAITKGQIPQYKVHDTVLCDETNVGFIATCWSDRSDGYPLNVTANKDFTVPPPRPDWCTYKTKDITIVTPPNGRAVKGRVYVCARAVKHQTQSP